MLESPKTYAVNTAKLLVRYLSKVVKVVNGNEKRIIQLEENAAWLQEQISELATLADAANDKLEKRIEQLESKVKAKATKAKSKKNKKGASSET